jgi:hypothetical protein
MSFKHIDAARDATQVYALDIFNKDIQRSVYNLVSDSMQHAMDSLPKEYMLLSERQLRKEVEPDFKLDQMRVSFWIEYQRAQLTNTRINLATVYANICASSTFHEHVIAIPKHLAWLLTPPTEWISGMRAILDRGMAVMYDAVNAKNIFDEDGNVNPKVLNAVTRVIKDASIVIHGLPTIRTETKSVNVNLNSTTPSPTHLDLAEKRKELERLKAERQAIPVSVHRGEEE